jgi:hypothetical protein
MTESVVNVASNRSSGSSTAVTLDSRKSDFKMIALRTDSFDLNRFTRSLRRSDNRLSSEVEWNSEDVRIFNAELPLVGAILIDFLGLPAKCSAYDLFAKKLRSERRHAQYVRHSPGVPAFREHRN